MAVMDEQRMPITIDDELELLRANAKRVQREVRMVVGDIARVSDNIRRAKLNNVQSQEDTTDNGTDRH